MTTTTSTIADRAAAGAAWLDQHEPGWVNLIDLGELDLGECESCILGQLVGDFEDAVQRHQLVPLTAVALGFDLDPACPEGDAGCTCDFPALTTAWRELIAGRRAGAA